MTDIDISRSATLRPVREVGAELGIPGEHLISYGPWIAKVSADFVDSLAAKPKSRLILVTGISPTAAGEGKTTTAIGLADALNRIGKRTTACLREPSLGPCFGMKGGATGGGYAQVVPTKEINLHFTGDLHAITAAHNLLSALIDNHVYWGNQAGIDLRRVAWKRVLDMNDRALREIVSSLGGVLNGFPRQAGFDITAASELMAILCLARDVADLQRRIRQIVVAYRRDRTPVFSRDVRAEGAMAALLEQALQPNLVQTLENNPALVHGGPFANIAHGCSSVVATRTALGLADYVVTEAGFGADLGAEKFFDIKCRQAGLRPDAAVIVATVRALKLNGGAGKSDLSSENVDAVRRGCANLGRHIENVKQFGVPPVVTVNHFSGDTEAEVAAIEDFGKSCGTDTVVSRHWADGSAGAEALARQVAETADSGAACFRPLYSDDLHLLTKIETVARRIYRAQRVDASLAVRRQLDAWENEGYGRLPVCMAKTQYSFSSDPALRGAPTGHVLTVREVRLSAGAGFVVAVCGNMLTMPGLPRRPAAESVRLAGDGAVEGLF